MKMLASIYVINPFVPLVSFFTPSKIRKPLFFMFSFTFLKELILDFIKKEFSFVKIFYVSWGVWEGLDYGLLHYASYKTFFNDY